MTQPDDRPIRWGILATGGIAHAFAHDLALQPDCEVVAVGSRSPASADAFGDEFGVPHRHASYQALVSDPDVDAVYVSTPHPGHHDAALLAINAGKAVLVEKPFAMDAARAREIYEGRGLRGEAAEVGRCLRAGLLESPLLPLDETYTIMQAMDEIRRQIGLPYPPA